MKKIFVGLLVVSFVHASTVFYLHKSGDSVPETIDLSGFNSNPEYKTVNCDEKDCSRFKAVNCPTIVFFPGAGYGFEEVYPPTEQNIRNYLFTKESGLRYALIKWIESLSILETAFYGSCFATFWYIVFTFICSPKRPQLDKAKPPRKKE